MLFRSVLHERPDLADRALGQVKAKFERPAATTDDQTIFEHLLKTAPKPQNVGSSGDLAEGEKASVAIVEETYLNSYVAHAPMETHSATAIVENGKATVWASTQAPFMVRQQVAQALGLTAQNVRIVASTSALVWPTPRSTVSSAPICRSGPGYSAASSVNSCVMSAIEPT